MTFTVLGYCEETDRFGVGIATYSLGVGGYCPFFARGRAVLSSQAFANPALGPAGVELLRAGRSATETLDGLRARDPGFDHRQVVVVARGGDVAAHTGPACRPWAGHECGRDFAAFGNVLAGRQVVSAIAAAYRDGAGADLAERLLAALEAGRAAGGQAGAGGRHLPERSAALAVRGADIVEDLDLRVDASDDAVTELRRLHGLYAPYLPYYALRARDPAATPPQDVWASEHLGDG